MKKLVSVSILSADFLNLKEELDKVKDSGADMIHFDVMDGIFVNNISFGFPVLKAVDQYSDIQSPGHAQQHPHGRHRLPQPATHAYRG